VKLGLRPRPHGAMGCRDDYIDLTVSVPQIAADLRGAANS
jgi:hypothetical protein